MRRRERVLGAAPHPGPGFLLPETLCLPPCQAARILHAPLRSPFF
ncbi:hypothetical protein HMPREF9946_01855 [Acetobacteraceae bacterium AT-5844]|nr:hypothetical protein HMPREF9946_01855 [Acetobacteraceae bacterium AT-5844]